MEAQKLPNAAEPLLLDAIICYKTSAYRASLLMSYLGFLVIIKSRIMAGNKPPLLPQQKWLDKLAALRNEDLWEAEVFSALQKKETTTGSGSSRTRTEDPFFPLSDGLRQQIAYWKDRRNDCAHNKDNIIVAGHIEAFWTFMISNLPKITIEGGMASLLNQLTVYYDHNQTPEGTPLTPLVSSIYSSVDQTELPYFWNEAFKIIEATYDWSYKSRNGFIFEILKLPAISVKESMLDYLKSDHDKLFHYIDEYPEVIQLLNYTSQEIRKLWKTQILQRNSCIKIYASLLRNNLIPANEIQEANDFFATEKRYSDDPLDREILRHNGYDRALYQKLFVEPDRSYYKFWNTLNNDSTGYRQYIEYLPINKEIVQFVCEELSKSWFSFYLAQGLDSLFQNNVSKKQEFRNIAIAESIVIPDKLPSLK